MCVFSLYILVQDLFFKRNILVFVALKGKKQDRGQLTMWITDDERRMPVKIQSAVKIGKINAILIRYEEPNKDKK